MSDTTCYCGHEVEQHGEDHGGAACEVAGCECVFCDPPRNEEGETRAEFEAATRPMEFHEAFVGFIGGGENSSGRFPANLSELAYALNEFAAIYRATPQENAK
jgi:hypothetical protein